MSTEREHSAESVPVEMHVRELPDRLRYLANYWSDKDRLRQLGVMLSLRIIADEIEHSDGGQDA